MKTYFKSALLLVVLLLQLQTKAQSDGKTNYGIYASADDFEHNKLSNGFNETNHNNRLVLYNTFGSSKIQIINNGEKKSFLKKDIYGYRDNGIDYRVFNGEDFLIVDTADFFIYNQIRQVRQMKWQQQKQTFYFFSVTANSNIEQLTRTNIENAFQYNEQFDHFLATTFKTNDELMTYDKRLKKYRLKYLYEEYEKGSLKNM